MDKKQKITTLAVSVGLILALAVWVGLRGEKKDTQPEDLTRPVPQNSPLGTFTPKEVEESEEEKEIIMPELPIYIENIQTSVGKNTTLNIFSSPYDPEYTLRLEIYGVNYNNSQSSVSNPDYRAFQETYYRALDELEKRGVDPENIVFIYGSRGYINEVASNWVSVLSGQ